MTYSIDEDGTFCEIRDGLERKNTVGRPALFLDRDGTIVEEVLYLHKPEDVKLLSGAVETIKLANKLSIPVIVVTNQSGIGRGYYGWKDFYRVQQKLKDELEKVGGNIDAVFACPYHKDGKPTYPNQNHPDRKPNPGMLKKAERLLSVDLNRSWIAGNRAIDVGAGHFANCAGGVHLKTGHGIAKGEAETAMKYRSPTFRLILASSISELPNLIPFLKC